MQDFAFPGQPHGAAGANEQRDSQLILNFLDLMADGSRGYAHDLSCFGEAQMLGRSVKGAQTAKAGEIFKHGEIVSIIKLNLKVPQELVVCRVKFN